MTTDEKINYLAQKNKYDLADLEMIMEVLRSGQGCPWDREQDHHSIRSSLIEETYEVIEAIDTESTELLQEELGDLLFQIVFHAALEQEQGHFDMEDVIHDIAAKMVHRHPHVFATVKVKDSNEVLANWETIKTEEKQRNTLVDRLRAIPPMLPALMRAAKVAKKAELNAGCSKEDLLNSMEQQILLLKEGKAIDQESIGDLLITVIGLSAHGNVDAEEALSHKTDRVIEQIASKASLNP